MNTSFFPLSSAVLCVACDCISDTKRHCPCCGGIQLINLGRVLGKPSTEVIEDDPIKQMQRECEGLGREIL